MYLTSTVVPVCHGTSWRRTCSNPDGYPLNSRVVYPFQPNFSELYPFLSPTRNIPRLFFRKGTAGRKDFSSRDSSRGSSRGSLHTSKANRPTLGQNEAFFSIHSNCALEQSCTNDARNLSILEGTLSALTRSPSVKS